MSNFSDPPGGFTDSATPLVHPSPFSPLSVIRTLWKRKLVIAAVWLLVSAAVGVVAYRLPRVYRSEAVILIESQRIPERFVATTVNEDLQARLNTIGQQILSYTRLVEIITRFDLYREERKSLAQEEIVELMRGNIKIDPVRDWTVRRPGDSPGAFKISYQGPNPAVVSQVCNQLSNLFIDENLLAREVQAVGTSEFLNNQMADAKKRLEEQEALLSKYKLRYNGELPQQENALIANVARLQQQLGSVQEALARTEQNKMMLASSLDTAQASEAALTQIAEQIAASRTEAGRGWMGPTAKSRAQILTEQLEALRQQYTEEHPDIKRLKAELAQIEKQEQAENNAENRAVAAAKSGAVPASPTLSKSPELAQTLLRERERVESLRAQLAATTKQIAELQKERDDVVKQLNSVQSRIEKLPLREQELATVMRDYEISKANYRSLLDKKLSAEMAAEMEKRQKAERFSLLDAPRVPEKPIKPDRWVIAGIGSLAGLLLGLVSAAGAESRVNAILGEWELPYGVPVLGRVPRIEPLAYRRNGSGGRPGRKRRLALTFAALAVVLAGIAGAALYLYLGRSPF